jgi:hypothetical protein
MVEKIISISQLDTVFNIHDIEENTLNKLLWKTLLFSHYYYQYAV